MEPSILTATARTLRSCGNSIQTAHIWSQGFWNDDRAVRLLIVLDDREPGAADSQSAAIQRVHELVLAFGVGRFEADVGSAGLEGFEVGAGRNLAIETLARQPDFEIKGL